MFIKIDNQTPRLQIDDTCASDKMLHGVIGDNEKNTKMQWTQNRR